MLNEPWHPGIIHKSTTQYWIPSDSQENFQKNINIKESSEFEADKANEIKLDYLKKNEKKFTEKVKKNFYILYL